MEFASFYVGSGIAPHLEACLRSWGDFGHSLALYTYDPHVPVPPGVERRDANEIIPSSELYVYRRGGGHGAGSVAAFSNEFRYQMVMTTGRVWVDTDVLCLSAQWPNDEYLFAWESPERIRCNTAVFGAPADSDLVAASLKETMGIDKTSAEHGQLGPVAFTRVLETLGFTHQARDFRDFYAVSHRECSMFLDPSARDEVESRTEGSLALHLWDEVWTRARFPTFMRPPKGSFLEGVYERHHVNVAVDARIEDTDALDFRGDEVTVPIDEYERLRDWALSLEAELLRRDGDGA